MREGTLARCLWAVDRMAVAHILEDLPPALLEARVAKDVFDSVLTDILACVEAERALAPHGSRLKESVSTALHDILFPLGKPAVSFRVSHLRERAWKRYEKLKELEGSS